MIAGRIDDSLDMFQSLFILERDRIDCVFYAIMHALDFIKLPVVCKGIGRADRVTDIAAFRSQPPRAVTARRIGGDT